MAQQCEYAFGFLPTGQEPAAAELVEQTFLQQVARHFSPQGANEFLKNVSPQAIASRLAAENFMLAASDSWGLAGILEANAARGHIVWFFVKPEAQGRGLGRELLKRALAELKRRRPELFRVTVNVSPNSVDAYLSLGFIPSDHQQEKSGVRFTPMTLLLG